MARRVVLGILIVWMFIDAVLTFRHMPTWRLAILGSFGSLCLNCLFILLVDFIWKWLARRHRKSKPSQ